MKNLLFAVFILLSASTAFAQTQKYQNRQLALISFSYNITKDIKPYFDVYNELFPDVENKRADRIIAAAKEYTWYMLKARLEAETGMYILPLTSHGNTFKYDEYNFPNVTINRALKNGSSRYYLKVDLTISSSIPKGEMGYGAKPSTDTTFMEGLDQENACLPVMNIEVTLFNDKGILPIQKVSSLVTATAPWVMGEDIFKGLINREEFNSEDTNTLLGLTNVCISKLLRQF